MFNLIFETKIVRIIVIILYINISAISLPRNNKYFKDNKYVIRNHVMDENVT